MSKGRAVKRSYLLPFRVIEAAAGGDVDAINKVLKHFEGYIVALSTRELYDGDGKPYRVIDNDIRRTLETKLIIKVLQFDTARVA